MMNPTSRRFLSLTLFVCIALHAVAQTDSTSVGRDTTYTLVGNILSTNHGFKIVVGQPIIIGKASDEHGWYHTITFKNPTAWPLLLFRDIELSQSVDYQTDASIRERDKIKDSLPKGDTLTITKIKRFGKKGSGKYWYVVWMRRDMGLLSLNFRCYITDAIRLGEVVLPKQ
jgi:hypothetical protein